MSAHFDLNDLMAFRAVAELGNFRKAAESVHISQPAFSRRIDKLEQALGVRLLERSTRRVSLTVVGRDFDRQLRQILDALDTTLLGIRGVAATRMGEVTIAAVPSAQREATARTTSLYGLTMIWKRPASTRPNSMASTCVPSTSSRSACVSQTDASVRSASVASATFSELGRPITDRPPTAGR